MNKAKILLVLIIIVFMLITLINEVSINHWTIVYKSELDKFFGKDNWVCISDEVKNSIYKESQRDSSETIPMRYKSWTIKFNNSYDQEEICVISNHTLKLNNKEYGDFSKKRYSNKQALCLELMNISRKIAGQKLIEDILKTELSDMEIECLKVSISKNGNPPPKFYNKLLQEDWFNINDVSAEKFLSCNLYDFYIDIFTYNYKFEKLTIQEQQKMINNLKNIERKLVNKYGSNASFEIYINKENKVKYINGKKQ